MSYDALIERLQQELGLDPDSIGALTLRHGIDEARAALDCASVAELYTRTCTNAADWHRFIDLMVVPETWFFRVPEQYADLVRQVRAIEARPLRILSLPCSTGEEPYSIAASLLEAGWAPQQFDILGVDVSEQAIQTAQRAVYRPSSLRGMAPGPWIELDAGQVQPVDAVRRSVRFLRANALSEHALPPGLRFHAIFCRNLLIYLDASSRARLLDLLIAHLQPGGLIYAGQAEALASMDARLCPAVGYGALTCRTCGTTRTRPGRGCTRAPAIRTDGDPPGAASGQCLACASTGRSTGAGAGTGRSRRAGGGPRAVRAMPAADAGIGRGLVSARHHRNGRSPAGSRGGRADPGELSAA